MREVRDRVSRLERGDDALAPREQSERLERLRVVPRNELDAIRVVNNRELGPDSRVVQTGGYGVRLADLPVLVLQHVAARSVQHADRASADRRCVLAALDTETAGFDTTQPHLAVV